MMGHSYTAICSKCGEMFHVSEGGGFMFHLLHCQRCGMAKSIGFDEIGEPHLRYLKGLPGPYSIMTRNHDKNIKKTYAGEPLSEREYNKIVEELAGKCSCGGQFKFKSRARCPKCKSSKYVCGPSGIETYYD